MPLSHSQHPSGARVPRTVKVAVVTSSEGNTTFLVDETTFKVAVITFSVAIITFVVAEITLITFQ